MPTTARGSSALVKQLPELTRVVREQDRTVVPEGVRVEDAVIALQRSGLMAAEESPLCPG